MTLTTLIRCSMVNWVGVALLAMSGSASADGPVAADAASASSATSSSSTATITSLIGDADCDNQTQCHPVGIGAKPCGGPSGYLAWSDKTTDRVALKAAVEAQSRAEAAEHKARGMASDCMVTPEPTAVCRPRASDGKKTCQLGQGGVRSAI